MSYGDELSFFAGCTDLAGTLEVDAQPTDDGARTGFAVSDTETIDPPCPQGDTELSQSYRSAVLSANEWALNADGNLVVSGDSFELAYTAVDL